MKIILISGLSGTGKTTVAKELCKNDRYHFVPSYTDRPIREQNEWGHTFVKSNFMDLILKEEEIVAQTKIDKYRYCSTKTQFDENKINVYIADSFGINDTIKFFPEADIMSILIRREKIEVDCIREERDVHIPTRNNVDFLVDNNYKIESAVNFINTLVNCDLFSRPSHTPQTTQDKIKYIDMQYRNLDEIKKSLYEQIWYENKDKYIQTCKHVEQKINDDFDFPIQIIPDSEPEIVDGYLRFNIIGEYKNEDILWVDMHKMVENLSHYAHIFCEENNYKDLEYHMVVGENYVEEDM